MDARDEARLHEALRKASEFGEPSSASPGHGQSGAAGQSSDSSAVRAYKDRIQELILQVCLVKILSKEAGSDEPYTSRLVKVDQEVREITARLMVAEFWRSMVYDHDWGSKRMREQINETDDPAESVQTRS